MARRRFSRRRRPVGRRSFVKLRRRRGSYRAGGRRGIKVGIRM